MKKFTAIFLLTVFLITNSGIAVTIHSCGGKIASIELISTNKHSCKCGKKVMKPGCCKSKTSTLNAQKDLVKVNQYIFKTVVPEFELSTFVLCVVVPTSVSASSILAFYRPPPDNPKVPRYLFNGIILV